LKGASLSASEASKNPAKIRTFGSAIFCGADFWQDKTQNAVNPIGFTSILTKYWQKSARKKRGSDYARYPTLRVLLLLNQ